MQITISPAVLKELEYMVQLHQEHGAPNPMESVEQLVGFVLASVADGSRRPGAWERGMLEQMGLIAECEAHQVYRRDYGPPPDLQKRAEAIEYGRASVALEGFQQSPEYTAIAARFAAGEIGPEEFGREVDKLAARSAGGDA